MRWTFGKRREAGKNPDWEYDVLCNSGLYRFRPVAAFDKKADPEGNRAGKGRLLIGKTAQQIDEKIVEM